MSKRVVAIAAVLPLFLLPDRAMAQAVSGTILGTVKDSSGAAIVNAAVVITGAENGVRRSVFTDTAGDFSAPLLPTGAYGLSIEAQGFKKTTLSNLQLGVDQKLRADLTLEVGTINETVQVEAQAP